MKQSRLCKTLMLFIMLVFASTACQYKLPPGRSKLMSNKESYDRQSFSQDGQSMVFGYTNHNYVIYVRDIDHPSSALKINLPFDIEKGNDYFADLCLAEEIWVTTPAGQIASYNTGAGTWMIHPRINNNLKTVFCHTLFDNRVVIFGQNQIAIYEGEWKSYEVADKEAIIGVAHNSQNQIYAISYYGTLFLLENDFLHELPLDLEDIEICLSHCIGFSSDDILWFADSNTNVYAWDPSANAAPSKFVLDVGQEQYEFIRGFFIGPRGQVWIDTTDGLWLIDNNQVQRITYPKEGYSRAYVEPTKERLYFSIGLPIYYYELKDLVGK